MRLPLHNNVLYSSAAHILLVAALLIAGARTSHMAPMRLPGTDHGTRLLTYYSPGGSAAPPASARLQKPTPHNTPVPTPAHAALTAPAQTIAAPQADLGTGTSGASSLGQGNINIALQKFFPPPHPDLSTLSPGTSGDVVIDATIDAQGNITQLTLVHGLTNPIDNAVLATVRNWTYSPATRDGSPIPSEQELLFHFSRG